MSKTAIPTPAARAAAAKPSRSQVVPPDDEPLTVADLREIRESEAALRRGDYVTLEELEDDVARLHSKEAGVFGIVAELATTESSSTSTPFTTSSR